METYFFGQGHRRVSFWSRVVDEVRRNFASKSLAGMTSTATTVPIITQASSNNNQSTMAEDARTTRSGNMIVPSEFYGRAADLHGATRKKQNSRTEDRRTTRSSASKKARVESVPLSNSGSQLPSILFLPGMQGVGLPSLEWVNEWSNETR